MIHISANWEYGTMSTVDLIDEDDNESDIATEQLVYSKSALLPQFNREQCCMSKIIA
jgi:hypothetical protein